MTKKNHQEAENKEKIETVADECQTQDAVEQTEDVAVDLELKTTETPKDENLSEKLSDLLDKHLRLSAEFDNYRKRTLKEKSDLIKTGGETVLINMLPIVDDMERAMSSINSAKDIDALKEGMVLIFNKFASFITQSGIVEIDAKEKDFDTDLHEAIAKVPVPTEELKGKVIDVIQKGYLLHDKVVRHVKVVVGE